MKWFVFLIVSVWVNFTYAAHSYHCNELQKNLNQFRVQQKISGMALYVKSPNLKSSSCYLFSGSVKKDVQEKISQNNLWQIASITKSYFSAILLQLEADSAAGKIPIKFNIDQKLKQWLPQYPDWGDATIRQLLNMTSGIYSYTQLPISQMVVSVGSIKKNSIQFAALAKKLLQLIIVR